MPHAARCRQCTSWVSRQDWCACGRSIWPWQRHCWSLRASSTPLAMARMPPPSASTNAPFCHRRQRHRHLVMRTTPLRGVFSNRRLSASCEGCRGRLRPFSASSPLRSRICTQSLSTLVAASCPTRTPPPAAPPPSFLYPALPTALPTILPLLPEMCHCCTAAPAALCSQALMAASCVQTHWTSACTLRMRPTCQISVPNCLVSPPPDRTSSPVLLLLLLLQWGTRTFALHNDVMCVYGVV